MNKPISKQIEPYNVMTRELFTRGDYKDNSVYPKGRVIKVRKGSLDDGLVAEIVTVVEDEKIVAAKYRIYGCPHSIASLEWICERIDGLIIHDLSKIDLIISLISLITLLF